MLGSPPEVTRLHPLWPDYRLPLKALKDILDVKDQPFEQALIQADPALKYEELLKVVDIYSSLKITKISFAELEPGAAL